MTGGSEARERYRLLPEDQVVHSSGDARIGFSIGIGEAVGVREEILHRAEKSFAVFVAHGRERLSQLGAQKVFATAEVLLSLLAIPFVVVKDREILDGVAGARMIGAEDFFANAQGAKQ